MVRALQVTEGMDVATAINNSPTGYADRPDPPIMMIKVTIAGL